MTKTLDIVKRLEVASTHSRELDALVTGLTIGPEGWILAPVEDLDGWSINRATEPLGHLQHWMDSADIKGVTQSLDAVIELSSEALPDEAAVIARRGFIRLLAAPRVDGETGEACAARAARFIAAELVLAVARASTSASMELDAPALKVA